MNESSTFLTGNLCLRSGRVLQQMMRHESIDTTMQYYVGRNAAADALWEAVRDSAAKSTDTMHEIGFRLPLEKGKIVHGHSNRN